jgi:hypothetical protein
MLKIVWLGRGGLPHDIGGAPMFAPSGDTGVAKEYVVKRIWPHIRKTNIELSGFALMHLPSQNEVLRWRDEGHDAPAR